MIDGVGVREDLFTPVWVTSIVVDIFDWVVCNALVPAVESEEINELEDVNGKCEVLFSRRLIGSNVVFEGAVNFVELDITLILLMVAAEFKLVDNFEVVNVGYDVPIYKCVTFVNFEEANGYEIVSILFIPMDEGVTKTVLEIFILDGTIEGLKEVD